MRGYALAGVAAVVLLAATGVVAANAAPMAEAGLDQDARVNVTVYLDAGGSWDPDGNLTAYEWRIERPDGTTTTPACAACPRTRFVPRQVGRYNVTVSATDGDGATAADTLYLDVSSAPPSNPVVYPSPGSGSNGGPGAVPGSDGGSGGGGGASVSVDPSRILRTASGEYLLRTPDGLDEGEFVMPVGEEKVRIPESQMNSMAQDDGRVTYKEVSDQFNEAGANRGDIRNELQNSPPSCGGNVCTAMVLKTTGAPETDGPSSSARQELASRLQRGPNQGDEAASSEDGSQDDSDGTVVVDAGDFDGSTRTTGSEPSTNTGGLTRG
jgi:hypothetical protein